MKNVTNIQDAKSKATVQRGRVDNADYYKGWNKEKWRKHLIEGVNDAYLGNLECGKRIYDYKVNCETKRGGSTFSQDINQWLGMSQSTANTWVQIGKRYDELTGLTGKLPSAYTSIGEIATLESDEIEYGIKEKLINSESTQSSIRALKKKLREPKPVPGYKKESGQPTPPPQPKATPKPAPKKDEDEAPPTQAELQALADRIYDLIPRELAFSLSNDFSRRMIGNDYHQLKTMLDSASKSAVKKPLRAYLAAVTHLANNFKYVIKANLPQAIKDEKKRLNEYSKELDEREARLIRRTSQMEELITDKERKVLFSFCHPDKYMDPKMKKKATAAFKILRKLD